MPNGPPYFSSLVLIENNRFSGFALRNIGLRNNGGFFAATGNGYALLYIRVAINEVHKDHQ